jgi:tetratricopeptide (TPR) repeat protein
MKISSILAAELRIADQLVRDGKIETTIDRLMYVLSQMDSNNLNYAYECSMVLRALANAAAVSGQYQLATRFIRQAVRLIKESENEVSKEFTYLYLDMAEVLAQLEERTECHFFAESALHALADCSKEFDLDEIAGILRRYASVARKMGSLSSAYLALTVGLLVMQDVSGLDSVLAEEASELTSLACQAAAPSAIGRLGNLLLRQAA